MKRRRLLSALQCLTLTAGVAAAVAVIADGPAAAAEPDRGFALGFGANANGQVGDGAVSPEIDSPTAAHLPAGVSALQVAPGYSHTVALGSDGVVYAWGSNGHGELGNGGTAASAVPTPVALPAGTTVSSVGAGYYDSYAVTTTGAVYAWGLGQAGQLGNGTTPDTTATPVLVQLPAGVVVTAVSAGYWHTLALTSTGAVYAWGANSGGQLGDATITARTTPVLVHLPAGVIATAVAAGYSHSLALTKSGGIYAWGVNTRGQLGTGSTVSTAVPVAVQLGSRIATSIAAGYQHSVATLSDGSALSWGDNTYGQLAVGESASKLAMSTTPLAVLLPAGTTVSRAAAGLGQTLLLTDAGAVLGAGDNSYGELGTGDSTATTAPVPTALPAGGAAIAVATSAFSVTGFVIVPGIATTTVVSSSAPTARVGQAVTFTATVAPNTGLGTVSFSSGDPAAPLAGCQNLPLVAGADGSYRATCSTSSLPAGTTPVAASYAAGAPYLDSAGSLPGGETVGTLSGAALGWGGNSYGQVGDGGTTNRTAPVLSALPAGSEVVQVTGGYGHGLALLADGSVYAWGDNTYGELGNGTLTSSDTPARVAVPAGVVPVTIAAGLGTSAFVTADGAVYAWGVDNVGQLGNGSTDTEVLPTRVALPSGTVATAVSLGGAHMLVLVSTGAVYAAGGNNAGQLGDVSTAPSATPVAVRLPSGVRVVGIAAGYGHSLAVTSDGAVLAWGDNSHGELGKGDTTASVLPVAASLPAGVTVTAVDAGDYDSLALASDGRLLTWGDNASGELGTGTTTDLHLPAPVSLPGGKQASGVAAGSTSSYALATDGTVYGWGDNSAGSVGDGSTTARLTPVPVHLPSGATVLALGAGGSGVDGYVVVRQHADQTTVTSSGNPVTAGKPVTFTATVTPGDGGGTVAFADNGATISGCAAVALSGTGPYTAKCTTSSLAGGGHDIVADYSGDVLYAPSSGTLAGGETVDLVPTTTSVKTSAATIQEGKTVTFTASVSGSDGHGTVSFAADGATIAGCSAQTLTLNWGPYVATCKTAALIGGPHSITATYSGNAKYASSTGTLSGGELVTVPTKLVASKVVISDPNGLPTYIATLTTQADGTPVPGMTVTFALNSLYGSSKCTAVTDDSGVASCQGARPKIPGGQYTAKFAGSGYYLASSGTSTVGW